MRKLTVLFLIGFFSFAACKKLKQYANKYAPYKIAIQGMTKAYKKATEDLKKAQNAEQVGNVFDYLAGVHKSTNKTILKLRRQYPELEDLKAKEFPKVLQEDVKEFKKVAEEFGKVSQEKLKKYGKNKLVQNLVKKWLRAAQELSKKRK